MPQEGEKVQDASGCSAEESQEKPWRYSKRLYKQWNVVEQNFRKIKEFRRVFTQYGKLDETYNAFIAIANIAVYLKN